MILDHLRMGSFESRSLIKLRALIRGEFLEQTLRNEGCQWNILSIFLHLFLGILRTLECEILESYQHPSSCINSTDQLIGGT